MSEIANAHAVGRRLALFNFLYITAMLTVIAGVLTTAMIFQYGAGELPCPLCLLQRAAMFGVCFGLIQNLRQPFSYRGIGLSLLFAIFLLIISVRQTLLDIYPRPGHSYIGSAVFGIHMPVWSILIALALLIAFAVQLVVLGNADRVRENDIGRFPNLRKFANAMAAYVIAICLINTVSVVVQCGFGQCHTMGYRLLP